MKMLFSLLILFGSASSFGQVILDQQLNYTQHDYLFPSANEPHVVYMMPHALNRMGEVKTISVGDRVKVQFDVGIPDAEYARIDALISAAGVKDKKSAVIHAVDVTMEPGTNIDDRYRPIITVAGDVGDLTGPVRYVLSVRNRGPHTTASMLKKLFGPDSQDHIANLKVHFSAVFMGQPYNGSTVIPVMVGQRDGVKPFGGLGETLVNPQEFAPALPALRIIYDRDTGCWTKPEAGVVCLQ